MKNITCVYKVPIGPKKRALRKNVFSQLLTIKWNQKMLAKDFSTINWLLLSDTDFRFSFHKLCFSCSFLLILNNEKISKKFWAMAAHQKLNSLISVFLITLLNPMKKNNLGAKVSVTQDWHFHPPSAVQGRRERKFIYQYGCQWCVTKLLWHP